MATHKRSRRQLGRRWSEARGAGSTRQRLLTGRLLRGERCEARRVLSALPPLILQPEPNPADLMPGTRIADVSPVLDGGWISFGPGSAGNGPMEMHDGPPSGLPRPPGPQPPREDAEPGGPAPGPAELAPQPAVIRDPTLAALEIERREWTMATVVRYRLAEAAPLGGGMVGSERRADPVSGYIDVGRGTGGPAKSLRAGPTSTVRPQVSPARAVLAIGDLRRRIDADAADPAATPAAAAPLPGTAMQAAAASRSRGMMLLVSSVVPTPERRPARPPAEDASAMGRDPQDPAAPTPQPVEGADAAAQPTAVDAPAATVPTAALHPPEDREWRGTLAGFATMALVAGLSLGDKGGPQMMRMLMPGGRPSSAPPRSDG